jgi:hypothetical protein
MKRVIASGSRTQCSFHQEWWSTSCHYEPPFFGGVAISLTENETATVSAQQRRTKGVLFLRYTQDKRNDNKEIFRNWFSSNSVRSKTGP